MSSLKVRFGLVLALLVSATIAQETSPIEDEVRTLLDEYNAEAVDLCNELATAQWNVATNVGDAAYLQLQDEAYDKSALFQQEKRPLFEAINASAIGDRSLRRQVTSLKQIGISALDLTKLKQFTDTVNSMTTTYNTATVCPYENQLCNGDGVLRLDPDLEQIMAESTDYSKLQYVWEQWHDKSGAPMHEDYASYVALSNDAAVANGFENAAKWWQDSYELLDFDTIEETWREVKPLYDELHTYVRNKLTTVYNNEEMRATAPNMPAHIFGNMWAQSWQNVANRIRPYDVEDNLGAVTQSLIDQQFDARRMFELADEFFVKIDLPSNAMSFDPTKAEIVDPMPDRQIECHASAWDFCKDHDFRIKMCTSVNLEDLNTIHHEMGHIAYFQQYAEQPLPLRGSANPAFHEAVGDAISLSFANPNHLKKIGLLNDSLTVEDASKAEINSLFAMAMERVAFLPFGLLIDKWRWEVFNGTVPETMWNERWWQLREEYQKIVAPSRRTELHFDAGAKYHVAADAQYIGYFFAGLLQFQIYRSMCIEADQYNPENPSAAPLNQCDFYDSPAAGNKLKSGLRLGTSEPWPEVLETMTGERTMNGGALMEYFEPLHAFLKQANRETQQDLMRQQLITHSTVASSYCTRLQNANWDTTTDLLDVSKQEIFMSELKSSANFNKEQFEKYFKDQNPDDYDDVDVKRQVMYLSKLGVDVLPIDDLEERQSKIDAMVLVYNTATICPYNNQTCDLASEGMVLSPDMESVLATSDDFEELKYVWAQWHDKTGTNMRSDYRRFVELSNEAAVLNGFSDYGDMLRSNYEDDLLQENMMQLWSEVEPLYDALHTYVRHSLIDKYQDIIDVNDDLIPAHLLGNMWAQSWVNLYESIKPFKNASDIDVSESMKSQMTVLQMFQESDRFYKDLGLMSNEMSYTGLSIIENPDDRLIVCHASAWDFCDGEDFRIKQCTQINQKDFVTVHHEMGHIQYYIQYANKSLPFRQGANPGFHEAIGDLIALSVSTPQHLVKIGLLESYADTEEDNINALLKMALERVAFMPFGLIIDMYRWEIFSGAVSEEHWNDRWEELREQFQKVRSPVDRSEDNFDAGAKFHVATDGEYINYFIAHILEFQLHKAMCNVAGELDNGAPLHKCDVDGSTAVGERLAAGLSAGSSRHWSETLQQMTGDTVLKSDAMLEYFAPLLDYLKVANEQWEREANQDAQQDLMRQQLITHSTVASDYCTRLQNANWDTTTDLLNATKQEIFLNELTSSAIFHKDQFERYFKGQNPEDYDDVDVSRQVKYLSKLGVDILPIEDLEERQSKIDAMVLVYNTATICSYDKQTCDLESQGMALSPEIENLMASSNDYEELRYVWAQWHDKTGNLMRSDYQRYVELSNEAAVLNNYTDYGDMWRSNYEDELLQENILKLWSEVEPLYDALHTYVRHSLIDKYPVNMDVNNDLIPAHLLGNMWAQSWVNLYESIKPFKNASDIDVSQTMKSQMTVLQMFQESDRFYKDLGLQSNEMSYTGLSIIEKPDDRLIVCHASAWDFCDGEDFRIKQCTQIAQTDFVTVHHEMGHIQYFIQYAAQPLPFRQGANPGFHEAVGDLIALSVSTPQHLKKIGLLEQYDDTEEDNINALLKMALERVAFLPFGLIVDMYRWEIFSGALPADRWNARWIELREQYQKVESPVRRTEANFDAGAKFHVATDSEYINYFIAYILEFQLHKAMCNVAGQLDNGAPLHKCDIDGSKAVGERLAAGLSVGSSRHWSETLQQMTGDTELKSDALLEYFAPLMDYLRVANEQWEAQTEAPITNAPTTIAPPTPVPDVPNQPDDEEEAIPWIPIIVGAVIGGAVLIGVVVALTYYLCKRNSPSPSYIRSV